MLIALAQCRRDQSGRRPATRTIVAAQRATQHAEALRRLTLDEGFALVVALPIAAAPAMAFEPGR